MNSFEYLTEQHKKQQDLIKLAFGGNTALLKLAEIQYKQRNDDNFLDIFDSQKRINLIINDSWSKSFQNETFNSIKSILSPLKNIAFTEVINKQLEAFNSSQFLFKSSLELMTKNYNENLFKGFNPILPAISEITKSFLKNVNITEDDEVEELEIVNIVTDRINGISESYIESGNDDANIHTYFLQINDSLLNLQQEIITLKPTKKDKWLIFIRDIIAIIGLISTFYNPSNIKTEKLIVETNKKVNNIDKRLTNIEEVINKNADNILFTNNYKCIKLSDVFLKPDKRSKKIGQIKKGQKIKILEVRRKYCCIAVLPKNNQGAIVGYILINNTNFND